MSNYNSLNLQSLHSFRSHTGRIEGDNPVNGHLYNGLKKMDTMRKKRMIQKNGGEWTIPACSDTPLRPGLKKYTDRVPGLISSNYDYRKANKKNKAFLEKIKNKEWKPSKINE